MQAQIGYASLETHEAAQFPEEAITRKLKFTAATVARKLDEESWAVSMERETNGDAIKNHEKHRKNSHEVAGGPPLTDDSNGTKSNVQNTHIDVGQSRHKLINIQIQIVVSFEWGFKIQLQ